MTPAKAIPAPALPGWIGGLPLDALRQMAVPLAVLALMLTALYERTDNLLAPITAHVLFNALNFAMLLVLQQMGVL